MVINTQTRGSSSSPGVSTPNQAAPPITDKFAQVVTLTIPTSGVAYQNTMSKQMWLNFTIQASGGQGTSSIQISPDNSTWYTVSNQSTAATAGLNYALDAMCPSGWWYMITVVSCTVTSLVGQI